MENVQLVNLGLQSYTTVWQKQEAIVAEQAAIKRQYVAEQGSTANMQQSPTQHSVLLCEHPPVYTLGKSANEKNLLWSEEQLLARGIELYKVNRGGDITFHGPEQLVGYPILDLEKFFTDIGKYLRNLEEVVIKILADYNLQGMRSQGETGVWLDVGKQGYERKICALGVRCTRWITMHGFAFNVNTDLNYFTGIVPCGIQHKQVTSLQKELQKTVVMPEIIEKWCYYFEEVFDCKLQTN
jgi:lipoyl(octanoyl) transferase